MTGENVVKFGNAEFHYKWLCKAAQAEYEAAELLLATLAEACLEAARLNPAKSIEAAEAYRRLSAPMVRQMSELKAGYWFADRIVLKADD